MAYRAYKDDELFIIKGEKENRIYRVHSYDNGEGQVRGRCIVDHTRETGWKNNHEVEPFESTRKSPIISIQRGANSKPVMVSREMARIAALRKKLQTLEAVTPI